MPLTWFHFLGGGGQAGGRSAVPGGPENPPLLTRLQLAQQVAAPKLLMPASGPGSASPGPATESGGRRKVQEGRNIYKQIAESLHHPSETNTNL